MNQEKADEIIGMISDKQDVSLLERAAWYKVLEWWEPKEAIKRLAEVLTEKPFLNPSDLNDRLSSSDAWLIVEKSYSRLGIKGDYGDEAINRAVKACRRVLREGTAFQAERAFKAAYKPLNPATGQTGLKPGGVVAGPGPMLIPEAAPFSIPNLPVNEKLLAKANLAINKITKRVDNP